MFFLFLVLWKLIDFYRLDVLSLLWQPWLHILMAIFIKIYLLLLIFILFSKLLFDIHVSTVVMIYWFVMVLVSFLLMLLNFFQKVIFLIFLNILFNFFNQAFLLSFLLVLKRALIKTWISYFVNHLLNKISHVIICIYSFSLRFIWIIFVLLLSNIKCPLIS